MVFYFQSVTVDREFNILLCYLKKNENKEQGCVSSEVHKYMLEDLLTQVLKGETALTVRSLKLLILESGRINNLVGALAIGDSILIGAPFSMGL